MKNSLGSNSPCMQVLTLFAGALLEKQIVVVCSNLVRFTVIPRVKLAMF